MHILEIEDLIQTLHEAQNSLSKILNNDADFDALRELPSRDNASTPHDIIRGANLRAKLGMKYGSQKVHHATMKLDATIREFDDALKFIGKPERMRDLQHKNTPVDEKKPLIDQIKLAEINLCQSAAANSALLARKTSDSCSKDSDDVIATGAPSIEDILQVNAMPADSWVSKTPPAFLKRPNDILSTSANMPLSNNAAHYFHTSKNALRIGGAMALSIFATMLVATLSVTHPEAAQASLSLLQ